MRQSRGRTKIKTNKIRYFYFTIYENIYHIFVSYVLINCKKYPFCELWKLLKLNQESFSLVSTTFSHIAVVLRIRRSIIHCNVWIWNPVPHGGRHEGPMSNPLNTLNLIFLSMAWWSPPVSSLSTSGLRPWSSRIWTMPQWRLGFSEEIYQKDFFILRMEVTWFQDIH